MIKQLQVTSHGYLVVQPRRDKYRSLHVSSHQEEQSDHPTENEILM